MFYFALVAIGAQTDVLFPNSSSFELSLSSTLTSFFQRALHLSVGRLFLFWLVELKLNTSAIFSRLFIGMKRPNRSVQAPTCRASVPITQGCRSALQLDLRVYGRYHCVDSFCNPTISLELLDVNNNNNRTSEAV